jgi:integrase
MRLTEGTVKSTHLLPPGKMETIIFDADIPGFGLRIRAGGSRNFIFQFKLGPKNRRMSLGRYPAISPTKARETAAKLYAQVKLGIDPAGIKADTTARAAETFGTVVKNYLALRRGAVRPRSYTEFERHLLRNLAPLHSLHITKVDLRAIAAQLTRLTSECGPVQANRTRETLSAFLNWCAGEGLVENNAATFANTHKETPRVRVLTASELQAIWNALPNSDFGDILKLLILSGQRANEIAQLLWSEIDLERGVIALPPSRTKNHRAHVIPISGPMRTILEARSRREGRDHVFGQGRAGFGGWSHCKARLDNAVKIPPWVIHDLRRTAATHMSDLGVWPHVIEAILNHVSGHKSGVAGIYNKSSYEPEKVTALARWGEHVMAIVEGRESNVTPLRSVS